MEEGNIFYVYVLLDPRKPGEYVYGEYSFEYEPFYVGKGKGDRCLHHFRDSKLKKNTYKCNKIKKIKRCGLKPIAIKIFENLYENDSFVLESKLIKIIGRKDLGAGLLVNLTNGGEGPSGVIMSEEAKKKLSKINTGKHPTEETRKKLSESHKGKKLSEEAIKKLIEINKNRIISDETRKKMSEAKKGKVFWNKGKNNYNFGKHHSEEVKRKMSESHKGLNTWMKGKKASLETCKKISESLKGHLVSDEIKRKIADAQRGEKNHRFGKETHHSEETRKKISDSKKGERNPNFGKPSWNKGISPSEETRRKISETLKNKPKSIEVIEVIEM